MLAQWLIWKEGSLPDEFWLRRKATAQPLTETPILKALWKVEKAGTLFPPEFVAEIEAPPPNLS